MAKMGRPLKFKSVKELEKKITKYFKDCEKNNKPLTITGLALELDTSRRVLIEYGKKEEYSNTIKKARLMCEQFAEQYLFSGKNIVGAIFNLKNNYGWRDKTETDITSGGKIIKGFNYTEPKNEGNNPNNKTDNKAASSVAET